MLEEERGKNMSKTLKEKRNTLLGFDPENEKECLEAVKNDPYNLQYVDVKKIKQKKCV